MQRPNEAELALIAAVMDLFTAAEVEPARGEELLAMLAGMSVGLRHGSLTESVLPALALGYKMGVDYAG